MDIELVIKIPKKLACEGFERPFTEEEKNTLIKAIGNGTPIPDNVTNGDVIGEPSRRKGHWIETEYHRWRCSICREKGMSEWDNIHNVRTNFCPNCGAKMGSEDKE